MGIEILEWDVENNQITVEITGNNGYDISDFEIKKTFIEASLNYDLSEELLFGSINFAISAKIIRK